MTPQYFWEMVDQSKKQGVGQVLEWLARKIASKAGK